MVLKIGERVVCATIASMLVATLSAPASAAHVRVQATVGGGTTGPALLPTGQYINALVSPGSTFSRLYTGLRPDNTADAAGAMTTALSPDGSRLLVLTSGYNANFSTPQGAPITASYLDPATGKASSTKTSAFNWVFIYNVNNDNNPQRLQQIQLPDTFAGITWDPSGERFYVSGGMDDRIYVYHNVGGTFVPDAPFIVLNHNSNGSAPQPNYDGGIGSTTPAGKSAGGQAHGLNFGAETAGVATSADGATVFAANLQNDSISVVNAKTRKVTLDFHLYSPGSTTPRGEYPFWLTPHTGSSGTTDKLYVSSIRDGQVIAISTTGSTKVITLGGEPGKMQLNADGSHLYVANPDLDEVDEIATATDTLTRRLSVRRPGYAFRGAMPNSVAITPDGRTIYTTLGGENAVGVIDVASGNVVGRIPTGWYPNSVTIGAKGSKLYIVNTKGNAGPNPANNRTTPAGIAADPYHVNDYDYALEKGGLLTVPIPDPTTLSYLSAIVDANNNFYRAGTDQMMAFLRTKIKHVIYIQKENRTYDQVLGDLGRGNGDPRLTVFPEAVTPNLHAIARQFTDLDNFYTSGDVSGDGWNWTEQGHANDYTAKYIPLNYSSGAFTYDANGTVRSLNPASPVFGAAPADRDRLTSVLDPSGHSTFLAGAKDPSADEGADDERPGQTGGYIWDSVLRAGLSVRHYGDYDDQTWYSIGAPGYIPIVRDAAAKGIVEGVPLKLALKGRTDPYFRGWDLNEADEYRFEEWKREFDGYVKNKNLPTFEPVLFMMDHTGNFATQAEHLNTPELEVSSNDHAVGQLIDAVSHSPYWSSTAIFVIEDDSQNGPDHVDAHRSIAFIASPWIKSNSIVHTNYNTDSMLRTMEDIMGIQPLGLTDANAEPMSDAFTTTPNLQPYNVIIPGVLCAPPVDPTLVPACFNPSARKSAAYRSLHAGTWWQQQSDAYHLVWNAPDKNDPTIYNTLLWNGIMGGKPFPSDDVATAVRDSDDSK